MIRAVGLKLWRSGGSADVYVGQCANTGQPVAVKFLRDAHLPHVLMGFEREAGILSKPRRGFVSILGKDLKAPRPWYAMSYFPGGSLTRWAGRLPPNWLHNVAVEIALAIEALHADWIIDGDIKPDNVLVARDGHLCVADPIGGGLGCTFLFSDPRGAGTHGYMAPEIAANGPISYAGDVYSYGVTIRHMLTGRAPREGEELELGDDIVVSAELRDVISNCCQADPNLRPSMKDVVRMLRGESLAAIRAQQTEMAGKLVAGGLVVAGAWLLISALTDEAA